MSTVNSSSLEPVTSNNNGYVVWFMWLLGLSLMGYLFWGAMVDMADQWQRDEYSHGYMIPLVALYIFWKKQLEIPVLIQPGPWLAVGLMALAITVYFVGEISTTFELMQYAMLLCLFSLSLAFFGWRVMVLVWAAFVYLIFMVPLPAFVYKMLSSELQLISSSLGVAVIRMFDISVYLEGNVIDLGSYQLQVVEACSGLRYLFPLMSFGFLIAYLFKAPNWQRAIIFLSTIPITVLMNSFRIGVIGVTVEYWGIEMAEGFLHDFEGWVVFMGCLGVLFVEMLIFHAFTTTDLKFWDRIDLDMPEQHISLSAFNTSLRDRKAFVLCVMLLGVAIAGKMSMAAREAPVLERKDFNSFPLSHYRWIGRETPLADSVLKSLKVTDYLMANYKSHDWSMPVNLWVAYYDSQRDGAGIHSPRTCIPGGGWEIEGFAEYQVPGVTHRTGEPLLVNRMLIRQGEQGQLVYYWFEQRGRNVIDEYAAKWYILLDSFNDNRTDGALVRVVVRVDDVNMLEKSDVQLAEFLKKFYPEIKKFIPGK